MNVRHHRSVLLFFLFCPVFLFAQEKYNNRYDVQYNINDYIDKAVVYIQEDKKDSALWYLNFAVDNLTGSWVFLLCTDFYPLYDVEAWKTIEQKAIEHFYAYYECENKELALELMFIGKEDQLWRNRVHDVNKIQDSIQYQLLLKQWVHSDSLNLVKIEDIFTKYGYPTSEMVGGSVVHIPLLVIHHSGCEAIKKYYKFIKKAVKKESDPGLKFWYRYYEDRLLNCKGKKQKNGTQIGVSTRKSSIKKWRENLY